MNPAIQHNNHTLFSCTFLMNKFGDNILLSEPYHSAVVASCCPQQSLCNNYQKKCLRNIHRWWVPISIRSSGSWLTSLLSHRTATCNFYSNQYLQKKIWNKVIVKAVHYKKINKNFMLVKDLKWLGTRNKLYFQANGPWLTNS